jgi:hypothetical protein
MALQETASQSRCPYPSPFLYGTYCMFDGPMQGRYGVAGNLECKQDRDKWCLVLSSTQIHWIGKDLPVVDNQWHHSTEKLVTVWILSIMHQSTWIYLLRPCTECVPNGANVYPMCTQCVPNVLMWNKHFAITLLLLFYCSHQFHNQLWLRDRFGALTQPFWVLSAASCQFSSV